MSTLLWSEACESLVSPAVVDARRQGHDFYTCIIHLEPTWLVLRPWEAKKAMEFAEIATS